MGDARKVSFRQYGSNPPAVPGMEVDYPVGGGEEGIVRTDADIGAGMDGSAPLPENNRSRGDEASRWSLHAQSAAGRVPAVPGTGA